MTIRSVRLGWCLALFVLATSSCGGESIEDAIDAPTEPLSAAPSAVPGVSSTTTAPTTTTTAQSTTTTIPGTGSSPRSAGPAEPTDAGDPYFPGLGTNDLDVDHYTLALAADPIGDTFDATATLELTPTIDSGQIALDLVGLEAEAVEVDGLVADFEQAEGELIIAAPRPFEAGAAVTVVVEYGGYPTAGIVSGFSNGWIDAGESSYVVAEPDSARRWFPANDHPTDKATFRFEITAPGDQQVVANGLLDEVIERDDGQNTWIYEAADPMATYLATVAIGEFELTEPVDHDGITIRHAFTPDRAEQGRADTSTIPEMLDVFGELFGPYPFEAYGILVVDDEFGGAAETQTIPVFSRSIVTGDGRLESVQAHELAHQWFGDAVSPARWQDIWLNEGFATYAEHLWLEFGPARVPIEESIAPLTRIGYSAIGDPGPDDLFDRSVYQRGALTLHALRLEIGDDAFFEVLRQWFGRYDDTSATTDDFVMLSEGVSQTELSAFFDAWLNDPLPPELPD